MIASTILQVPVPKDIPLPMPMAEWLLVFLLILSFLLHILFINLMIGGSILTFWYEIRGIKNKDYDRLAREIAGTITVNKSMAVVLGVAPLLSINVLYTIYFYSANALTGNMWISIIPWVTVAFLVFYLHKYSWDKLANNKPLHLGILSIGIISFLMIPFIFLTNINLMLFPEKWAIVTGFFDAMTLPNVFPRYFHFIIASMAVSGVFLAWWFGRKNFRMDKNYNELTKKDVKVQMLNLALITTGMQFIFGPLLFLTLPTHGVNWGLFWVISGGVVVASIVIYQLWKLINEQNEGLSKRFYGVIILLTVLIGFMGTGRHMYRENALATHKKMMAERTSAHWEAVKKAKNNNMAPVTQTSSAMSPGAELFQTNCSVCHAANQRLVGPPLNEIVPIYENNLDALKKWIKSPGRKREDYPPMTAFPNLSDQQLTNVGKYLLNGNWK